MDAVPLTDAQQDKPFAAGSPRILMAEHDCWTGAAPSDMQGKVPGHVVASWGEVPVYSATLVGPALERIFNHKHRSLIVYGFCR